MTTHRKWIGTLFVTIGLLFCALSPVDPTGIVALAFGVIVAFIGLSMLARQHLDL